VLSLLATNSLDGSLPGMNPLQAQAEQAYGPGQYTPMSGSSSGPGAG
jgi:hypothetical protein